MERGLQTWPCIEDAAVLGLGERQTRCGNMQLLPCCANSWLLQAFHAKQVPVDRLLARRGSNLRWYDQAASESDSLAQGRLGLWRPFERRRKTLDVDIG